MSEQPEALRLAGWLQANYEADGVDEAAAELRRLHALCDELGRALEATRMPLDLYNAYGWPDRERGAVPEGYVAVPRFLAENHRNLTDVPRYQRILDDCLAAAHDQFRDATKMMAEPAEPERRIGPASDADVLAWLEIADALAPDGIPGEILAEALGPINDRLHVSAGFAEWEQVVIHSDMRITYGLRDYALISESETWRTDAMIAEAVSSLSGLRMLVLDRFDVLDLKGREDLLYWLDGMAEDGDIETALLFGTLKALPAQLPERIGAHWIDNGAAGQIKEAA